MKKYTLKTLIKLTDRRKTTHIIAELWEVYGHYFFFLPLQDPYFLHILQATHIQYRLYHWYNNTDDVTLILQLSVT